MTVRRNFSLDDDAAALLSRLDNASHYVSALVRDAWRRWQQAHEALRRAGWDGPALCAACDALNGTWLLEPRLAGVMSLELHDAQRLSDVCGKWGVDPRRWAELHDGLRDDLAIALRAIVTEFWAGNTELELLLQEGRR